VRTDAGRQEASTGSEHLKNNGHERNKDSVWTRETLRQYADTGNRVRSRQSESNIAQLRVMMVTGVCNEGQPSALERQRGGLGAGNNKIRQQKTT
jgi:hypothetical protein